MSVSIIIPSGPGEKKLLSLSKDLVKLGNRCEIILTYHEGKDSTSWSELKKEVNRILFNQKIIWIATKLGRGPQLNRGARVASGKHLWFLHADSHLESSTFYFLKTAIRNQPGALHYFKLAFSNDGPSRMMKLNEMTVRFRSTLLGSPFGDQGFCIRKDLFDSVGGYSENLPYGEDHVFVWRVRQAGIPVHCIQKKIFTSARKYRQFGWFNTTLTHNKLWIKQVIPEAKKYFQSRGVI